MRVKHRLKNMTDLGPTSIRLLAYLVLRPWWSFAASLRLRSVRKVGLINRFVFVAY